MSLNQFEPTSQALQHTSNFTPPLHSKEKPISTPSSNEYDLGYGLYHDPYDPWAKYYALLSDNEYSFGDISQDQGNINTQQATAAQQPVNPAVETSQQSSPHSCSNDLFPVPQPPDLPLVKKSYSQHNSSSTTIVTPQTPTLPAALQQAVPWAVFLKFLRFNRCVGCQVNRQGCTVELSNKKTADPATPFACLNCTGRDCQFKVDKMLKTFRVADLPALIVEDIESFFYVRVIKPCDGCRTNKRECITPNSYQASYNCTNCQHGLCSFNHIQPLVLNMKNKNKTKVCWIVKNGVVRLTEFKKELIKTQRKQSIRKAQQNHGISVFRCENYQSNGPHNASHRVGPSIMTGFTPSSESVSRQPPGLSYVGYQAQVQHAGASGWELLNKAHLQ